MENTYTYTARSAAYPEKVVTFTLYDHSMSVELGVPLEHIERAVVSEGDETEIEAEAGIEHEALSHAWLKPTAVSLLQRGTRPFSVADVDARTDNDGLRVTAWARTKGLRLAPVTFSWDEVDNPEGAEAFARELKRRKGAAAYPGRFPGLLDYWASWFSMGLLLLVLLLWPRRETKG
jgi:hypothetical protein